MRYISAALNPVMRYLIVLFTPNGQASKSVIRAIFLLWVAILIGSWLMLPAIFPSPLQILSSLKDLWFDGLGQDLIASFLLNLHAMFFAVVISLGLAYLSTILSVRPLVSIISNARFLGLTGLTVIFTMITPNSYQLKVWLLVFGITVFYLTAMASEVAKILSDAYDHARTLRMGEWRVIWEVVVLGKLATALEILRQNASIGWMMLTMVEGLVIAGGGLGTLLIVRNKFFRLSEVFAVQLTILMVGVFYDYALDFLRKKLFPYSNLKLERR